MIKERDYRDGLERELASKLALIAQRGTFKCLDKNLVSYVDNRNGYNFLCFCFAVSFTSNF